MKSRTPHLINPAAPTDSEQVSIAIFASRRLLCGSIPMMDGLSDCIGALVPFLVWPEPVALRFAETLSTDFGTDEEVTIRDLAGEGLARRRWLARLVYEGEGLDSPHVTLWDAISHYFGNKHAEARKVIQATSRQLEARGIPDLAPDSGVAHFSRAMGLCEVDRALLSLLSIYTTSEAFKSALTGFRVRSLGHGCEVIGVILRQPAADVARALSTKGALVRTGIVERPGIVGDIDELLRPTDALRALSGQHYATEQEFVQSLVANAPPGSLARDDFPHLEEHTEVIVRLLAKALARGERGINVLLHGVTGTGKTEFAKVLAKEASARLHEVLKREDDGASPSLDGRLASLCLAQRFLKEAGKSLVLFDEAEDLFRTDSSGFAELFGFPASSSGAHSKAWLNETLETNPVPVLWITNRVQQIDPAYLRRFQYHLEVRKPPFAIRERIARRHLGAQPFGERLATRIAGFGDVSPADIASAARLLSLAGPASKSEAEAMIVRQFEQARRAAGEAVIEERRPAATEFEPAFLNASFPVPLADWTAAIKRAGRGSILLHGLPGTGKTSLVEHLARVLGRSLVRRSAADLQSKWLGETDKNIAAMFEDAAGEGAIAFLDEADSFLRERAWAERQWEVSQVNEMLQRMERFTGIFICATNLVDTLDKASLRRFEWKVEFKALNPGQRVAMFARVALGGDVAANRADLDQRLRSLDDLTPGDFSVVARRMAMLGEAGASADEFLVALEEECRLKGGAARQRSVGFHASIK